MGNKLVNVQVMKNAIGHDLPVAVHQAHFLCSKNANSRQKCMNRQKNVSGHFLHQAFEQRQNGCDGPVKISWCKVAHHVHSTFLLSLKVSGALY